ncbi:uncharacterized protein [Triticum aestivum]|uniref:uncharacterized protein n=1 Tax=Triticum aestivum TaxID=4565 RepID=UPI001D010098|nr:uncharacterized protein LOC123058826 [Triticum aestivum]
MAPALATLQVAAPLPHPAPPEPSRSKTAPPLPRVALRRQVLPPSGSVGPCHGCDLLSSAGTKNSSSLLRPPATPPSGRRVVISSFPRPLTFAATQRRHLPASMAGPSESLAGTASFHPDGAQGPMLPWPLLVLAVAPHTPLLVASTLCPSSVFHHGRGVAAEPRHGSVQRRKSDARSTSSSTTCNSKYHYEPEDLGCFKFHYDCVYIYGP